MTDEQAKRLEERLDRMEPIIEALGRLLVRRKTAIDRTGMGTSTLNQHPAFEEIGKVKTYIEVGEIAVIKQRKRTKKRSTSSQT